MSSASITDMGRDRDRLAGLMAAAIVLSGPVSGPAAAQEARVCTDRGAFTIELASEAPAHVANFVRLVESGFYNGTVFHRVIADRIVQGGGYDRTLARRPAGDPVVNESQNGLTNTRGSVAAARLRDPNSATSQFYINLADNEDLDATSRRPGYTVFGRVTTGMDVLDAIGKLPTRAAGPLPREVPDPIVVIEAITIVDNEAGAGPAVPSAETDASEATQPGEASGSEATDPDAVLARIDAQRAGCRPVAVADLVDEAEAALGAGLMRRARFALDNYFALTGPDDPDIFRAQALYRRLPRSAQAGIAALVAHCPRAEMPELPEGRTASLDDMQAAQGAVREFLNVSEAYLECLSDVIDGGSLDDAQEVAAVSAHNDTVSRMETAAEAFNNELREYRARQ